MAETVSTGPVRQGTSGPSVHALAGIAVQHGIILLAGLFEREAAASGDGRGDRIYNTYICAGPAPGGGGGSAVVLARHRKLHSFISGHLSAGDGYTVFDLLPDWRAGILICYDNNVVEMVRATALLGADVIFAPHLTMCTPSTRPRATGFVDRGLWDRLVTDPTSLRAEFNGLKGRAWMMKWLPSRAYDNGVYAVFSNPIGPKGGQAKNGCAMVLNPFGDVVAECRELGEGLAVAVCGRGKIERSGGKRYMHARRPGLYGDVIGRERESELKVVWLGSDASDAFKRVEKH